jgi:hypothetical protein
MQHIAFSLPFTQNHNQISPPNFTPFSTFTQPFFAFPFSLSAKRLMPVLSGVEGLYAK